MKRVLALYYSQTGQLGRSLEAFLSGLDPATFEVHRELLRLREPHPFPWSLGDFFDAFPESVVGDPGPLEPLSIGSDEEFDLVVLGYTVWFLAPSLPVQSFFRSEYAALLQGRPVVTVIACRNMWHTASERMKRTIAAAGGRLMDNVVVTDQGPAWATFVTTPRWMFTGRTDPFWFFPAAGVAAQDITGLDRFGQALSRRITADGEIPPGPLLGGLGAVEVESKYILPEMVARFSFLPWAYLVRAVGRVLGRRARRVALVFFVVYLACTILLLIPLLIVLRIVLYPFLRGWLRSYTNRLLAPSGA